MPLIECVPNISEGRRDAVIERLADAIKGPGVRLLDQSSDPSHNRTVYTFVAELDRIQDAALRLFAHAIDTVDLRTHQGVHPRIGAVDVIPFVPLGDATMEQCVSLARRTAAIIAERFGVPCFLYESAALDDNRRDLAEIRRGGLNGLAHRMRQSQWHPDFGPHHLHPSAGATAVGARPILIAYNVNLATNRLSVAQRIASAIRASNGGLPSLKAMGVLLEHRGIVQVSMNLTNYRDTSIVMAFDAVAREAAVDGVRVLESEIVGLVPADALPPSPERRLKLRTEDLDRVLETRLGKED